MRIDRIQIKGFRNFDNEEILFQPKTLIIGANDVGKTNLLYALRLLFDKSINEHDLELTNSDYNAYTGTDKVEITVTLCDIVEDCLLSAFGGSVKDSSTFKYNLDSFLAFYNYALDQLPYKSLIVSK